ncbi:hypothetical protein Cni_G21218 [Canna indica]|uniref:Uncharacterized protein n=1 Tax=Canna indica TaxID=4628 RepID=A0AAQ3QKH5_9LILI|nr:hypothetical protein Cni_G21218 [Canna indica]
MIFLPQRERPFPKGKVVGEEGFEPLTPCNTRGDGGRSRCGLGSLVLPTAIRRPLRDKRLRLGFDCTGAAAGDGGS